MRSRKTQKRKQRGGGRPTGHPGSRVSRVLHSGAPKLFWKPPEKHFAKVAKKMAALTKVSEKEATLDSIEYLEKVQSFLDKFLTEYERAPTDSNLTYFAMMIAEKFRTSIIEANAMLEKFKKANNATAAANAAAVANAAAADALADELADLLKVKG